MALAAYGEPAYPLVSFAAIVRHEWGFAFRLGLEYFKHTMHFRPTMFLELIPQDSREKKLGAMFSGSYCAERLVDLSRDPSAPVEKFIVMPALRSLQARLEEVLFEMAYAFARCMHAQTRRRVPRGGRGL